MEKLQVAEEKLRTQDAKIVDAAASAEAQAEMMASLCQELKMLEEVSAIGGRELDSRTYRIRPELLHSLHHVE